MNRFAPVVCVGGPLLVVGLWILELQAPLSPLWGVGLLAALLGASGLVYGIYAGLDRDGCRGRRDR